MSERQKSGIGYGVWGITVRSLPISTVQSLIPNTFLFLILLLAAALRFYRLDGSSLWSDEGNTWALLGRSFGQIAQDAAADIHPPGYYWLLKVWTMFFGSTAWGMRSFSALSGILLVYTIYQITHYIHGTQSPIPNSQYPYFPLLAALLAALNPFQIYYSQEARMYLLLALESAGLFWAVLALGRMQRQFASSDANSAKSNGGALLLFCLCAIAGLWTHYSFPIILAAADLLALWVAFQNPKSKIQNLKSIFVVNLIALLAFLPWLPTAVERVLHWPKGGITTPLPAAIELTLQTLLFGPLRDLPTPHWPWLVGAVLLPLLGLLVLRRTTLGIALTLWLLAPLGLMLGLGLFSPAFLKFLLVASPAWCIATAAAPISLLNSPLAPRHPRPALRIAYGVIGVFGALLAYVTLPGYYESPTARDNYAGVARYVQVLGDAEHDLVLLNAPGQQEVWRYYDPGLPVLALPQQRPLDPKQTIATLAAAVQNRRQIFALFWATDEADPERVVERWLDQQTFKGLESWQGNVRFVTYSQAQELACQELAPAANFGTQIALTAQCQPTFPQAVAAGEVALVGLRWQAAAPISQSYRVTVQLLDGRNLVIAQHDGEPAGGSQPTTAWPVGTTVADNHGLAIPVGTPPGTYRLIVAMYDFASGQRLAVESGDAYDLGVVQVIRPQRPLPVDILPRHQRVDRLIGSVRLLGYEVYRKGSAHAPLTPLVAGDLVHFTFYWQAPTTLGTGWPADLHFTLQLGTQALEAALAGGHYPTGQWQAGDLVRGEFDLLFDGKSNAAELIIEGQKLHLPLP